jgi:hypothetical protein
MRRASSIETVRPSWASLMPRSIAAKVASSSSSVNSGTGRSKSNSGMTRLYFNHSIGAGHIPSFTVHGAAPRSFDGVHGCDGVCDVVLPSSVALVEQRPLLRTRGWRPKPGTPGDQKVGALPWRHRRSRGKQLPRIQVGQFLESSQIVGFLSIVVRAAVHCRRLRRK